MFLSFNNKFSTSYHIESNIATVKVNMVILEYKMSMDLSWSTHCSIICSKSIQMSCNKKNIWQILFSPSPLPIIILFSIMESTLNKRHYHTWESTEVRDKVYFGWLLIRLLTMFAQLTTPTTDVYSWLLWYLFSSNHYSSQAIISISWIM